MAGRQDGPEAALPSPGSQQGSGHLTRAARPSFPPGSPAPPQSQSVLAGRRGGVEAQAPAPSHRQAGPRPRQAAVGASAGLGAGLGTAP